MTLSKQEQLFHDYLFDVDSVSENPSRNRIPGASEVGLPVNGPYLSRSPSFDSEIFDITSKELSAMDQPGRSSVSPATMMRSLNVLGESSDEITSGKKFDSDYSCV